MGSYTHRRAQLREERTFRRGDPRAWSRARRNDGRRDCERIYRSDDRRLPASIVRNRPGPFWNHHPSESSRATAFEDDGIDNDNTRRPMKSKRRLRNNHLWRRTKSALASIVAFVCALLVIAPLALVLFHLLRSGASAVNWSFFTELPKPVGVAGGGM